MAESGGNSNKLVLSKKEMKSVFKTFVHLINTKNSEELREAMNLLPEETRNEFVHNFKIDKNLMFQACFSKATEIAEYLMDTCKAHVNEVIEIGDETLTALFIAIKTNNIELINLLLNHGADINWRDPENRSAIVYACYQNKMEAAYELKNRGADINDETNIVLCAKILSYFKRALKLGTDVNYIDKSGETILMKAVENGDVDIISLLVKENANIYLRSHLSGTNALDAAHFFEREKVLEYFKANSVYTLADKILSYDLCGAVAILVEKNIDKALELWRVSEKLRKKHSATLALLIKDNPSLKITSDLGTDEFAYEYVTMIEYFEVSLKVVCRVLEVSHPFLNRSFALVAYNPDFLGGDLTFDTLRGFAELNPSSSAATGNGVFVGMTGAISLCQKQFDDMIEDVETTALFIVQMVDLLTENFLPYMKYWPRHAIVFRVYKKLLLLLLHLIDYVVLVGCLDNVKVDLSIQTIAKIYLEAYPTSLLLIAIERGFSFRTVLTLLAAGADVNATDYIKNTPLHLVAEQPGHVPDKENLYKLLIECGAETEAANDFGAKPRVALTEI